MDYILHSLIDSLVLCDINVLAIEWPDKSFNDNWLGFEELHKH